MMAIQATAAGQVGLAQLEPSDGELLRRLFFRLSPESLYRRFHSPIVRPEQVQPSRLLDIDHRDREALAAVLDGEIVGVARYARWPNSDRAEISVVVADDWQRRGLATRMLTCLGELAEGKGIHHFTLTMQADNQPVLRLLRRLYPSARLTHSYGVYVATVPVGARGNGQESTT